MTGSLADLKNRHKGQTAIVLGNGPSREQVSHDFDVEVVVNDGVSCGRAKTVYRVVVDRPHLLERHSRLAVVLLGSGQPLVSQQSLSHWQSLAGSDRMSIALAAAFFVDSAKTFETQTRHPRQEPWDPIKTGVAWQYDGAPFACCSIAAIMGCSRIGVLGVDMRGEGFSQKLRDDVDYNYSRLRKVLLGYDIELVSLSPDNCTVSLPHDPDLCRH